MFLTEERALCSDVSLPRAVNVRVAWTLQSGRGLLTSTIHFLAVRSSWLSSQHKVSLIQCMTGKIPSLSGPVTATIVVYPSFDKTKTFGQKSFS